MTKRNICCLCLVMGLLVSWLTGCTGNVEKTTAGFSEEYGTANCPTGVVAENDRYQLLWDDGAKCAILYNKVTGQIYSTTPYDFYMTGVYDGVAAMQMYSPLSVTYVDSKTQNLRKVDAFADSIEKSGVSSEAIADGVKVTYAFPKVHITVAMEIRLCENSLDVRIPLDSIQEDDNLVFEVSVLPFLAAAKNDTDSYLMVPSGGGALIHVDQLSQAKTYSEAVYGEDLAEPVTMKKHMNRQIYLPVFGVKSQDSGLLAVIENGADCAYVNASAGDPDVGFSNVYTSFRLRGQEEIVYSSMNNTDAVAPRYSQTIVDYDNVSVKYIPLNEDVTYMGMAAQYRDYLRSAGILSQERPSPAALSVSFLGSTQIQQSFFGIPYMANAVTTSLEQTGSILEELRQMTGGEQLLVNLLGYGNGGLANTVIGGEYTISKAVGGEKAFSNLQRSVEENDDVMALDYELLRFQNSGSGFRVLRDASYGVSRLKTKLLPYVLNTLVQKENGVGWYVLSRGRLKEAMDKAIIAAKANKAMAISATSLCSNAYSDYRDSRYTAKSHMAEDVSYMLLKCQKNGLTVIAPAANAYAAFQADYITETPLYSSRFHSLDEEIPFYTLVFQGSKPLSSPSINTSVNVTETYLQAVATGMTLQFTLCNNLHDALQYEYDTAYISCRYADWKDSIAAMVQASSTLHALVGDQIIAHYEKANGLSCTRFENGVQVYVNYTDSEIRSPLGVVPAHGFLYQ